MINGTSEKPSGCGMMEVRGPARLRDMLDRQTVKGKNSHCGAAGKYAELGNISSPGLWGLEYNYRADGISNRKIKEKKN